MKARRKQLRLNLGNHGKESWLKRAGHDESGRPQIICTVGNNEANVITLPRIRIFYEAAQVGG